MTDILGFDGSITCFLWWTINISVLRNTLSIQKFQSFSFLARQVSFIGSKWPFFSWGLARLPLAESFLFLPRVSDCSARARLPLWLQGLGYSCPKAATPSRPGFPANQVTPLVMFCIYWLGDSERRTSLVHHSQTGKQSIPHHKYFKHELGRCLI